MLVIPLFGDQKRNAHLAVKLGVGLRLDKPQVNEENLYQAIKTILEDSTYSTKVSELNAIVSSKPFTAEETLLRWTDFLVKFKKVSNLTPASIDLSYIQYHNLDVFAILGLAFVIIFWMFLSCLNSLTKVFSQKSHDNQRHDKNE